MFKGKPLSEGLKKKLSLAKIGRQGPRKGMKVSDETKAKLSESTRRYFLEHPEAREHLSKIQIGKTLSEEHKKKVGLAGVGRKFTEETKKRLSIAKLGPKNPAFGKKHTEEWKQMMSDRMKGRKPWNTGKTSWNKGVKGEASHSYGKPRPDVVARLKGKPRPIEVGIAISNAKKGKPRKRQNVKDNKIERLMQDNLKLLGIPFEKNKPIIGEPDIFIEPNICIFCDGDYWHFNPSVKNFVYHLKAHGWEKIFERWKHDSEITESLQTKGYFVFRFWESEIKADVNSCIEQVVNYISKNSLIISCEQ